MATFFGEVVNAPSRAFWNDDDDLEDIDSGSVSSSKENGLEIRSVNDFQGPPEIKLFILVHGPLTTGFAKTFLLKKATKFAEIFETRYGTGSGDVFCDLDGEWRKKPRASMLYQLEHSTTLCLCSPDLDVTQAQKFTEVITLWTQISDKVMILTSSHSSSYLSNNGELPAPFLRELFTSKYEEKSRSKYLEQPNVVAGIPAGVLSWCEVFNIPGVLYIVYTDCNVVDSITTQSLVQLFSEMPVKLLHNTDDLVRKKEYDGPEVGSNLYI